MARGILILSIVAGGLTGEGLVAQTPSDPFWIYGQNVEERASSRIGYWYSDVSKGLGEVVVSYGRPVWKEDYSSRLDDLTKGKMWRMGDNYWTLYDSNLEVTMSGRRIPVGLYYLAVQRSSQGDEWALVFIDPEKSRAAHLDSFDVGTRPAEIPVLFTVPLTFAPNDGEVERLTILLKLDGESRTQGSLRLTWGNFSLTAPLTIDLGNTDSP